MICLHLLREGGKAYKTPAKGDRAVQFICSLLGKPWSQFLLGVAGTGVRELLGFKRALDGLWLFPQGFKIHFITFSSDRQLGKFGSFLPEAGKNKIKLQLCWQMVCYTQSVARNFVPCTLKKEIWTDAEEPKKSSGSLLFFQKYVSYFILIFQNYQSELMKTEQGNVTISINYRGRFVQ